MNFTVLITACFHALLFIVPFLFTWSNSELFEWNKMLAVYGLTAVITGLWLARMAAEKRLIWKKHPAILFVLIFLAGQAAATLFSIHFRTSLFGFYSRLNGGFFSSLAYVLLFLAAINNIPRKQTVSLLLTAAISSVLAALYALPEHFGVSPSCYLMRQEWNADCWKQNVRERVFGTFGQPNWLAMYLAGTAPLLWLFSQRATGWVQKFWQLSLLLVIAVLWFTQSRSGLLAAGMAAAVWAAIQYRTLWLKKLKKMFRRPWQRAGIGAAVIVLLIMAASLFSRYIPAAESEENTSFDLSQGTESGSIRLIVWEGALKVWQRYPWFGSGPGTFGYSYYQDRPAAHNLVSEWNFLYNKAHNEYLNYLAETGLMGALTYAGFLTGIIWLIIRQLPKNAQQPSAAQAVLAALAGLLTAHFFGFSTVTSNTLLFLLPAAVLLADEETPRKLRRLLPWQKIALAIIGLAVLWTLIAIGRTWKADWWYQKGRKAQEKLEYEESLTALQQAADMEPKEPLYYDELANLYSKLSLEYALAGETSASAQLSEAAVQNSDYAVVLNPRNLNFYKTRVRIFFILAQLDKKYLAEAERVLKIAIELAPTDAQLWYNLGIAQQEAGKFNEAVQTLQHTVDLKPDYVRARSQLGDLLVQLGRVEEGKAQYRFILEKLSSADEEVRAKLKALENQETE